jgi:anti-anti-sigma regulatory factor
MRSPSTISTPDDSCTLSVDGEAGIHVFVLTGIIDARAQQILSGLEDRVTTPKVRFDFAQVKRINSMGIALLLRCFKQIRDRKQAEIRLSNVNEVNAMLFRITGIFLLADLEEGSI